MSDNLQQAIAAIKAGDKKTGQQLIAQVIKADPKNEAAWLWMASTLDDPQEKKECLQKVLQINPDNEMAKKALAAFERPGEPAELPRLQDIAPKPAQEAAPSTDLVGTRMWRLSLFVLGGVAVLLVLCIGAMLVLPSIVRHEALVSVFGGSNPPVEQSLAETTVPAIEAYPPTTPDSSQEVEQYLEAIREIDVLYNEAVGKLLTLMEQMGKDPFIVSDNLWRSDWNDATNEWLAANRAIRRLTPPPTCQVHYGHLLTIAEHIDSATMYMKGLVRRYDKMDFDGFVADTEAMLSELEAATAAKEEALKGQTRIEETLGDSGEKPVSQEQSVGNLQLTASPLSLKSYTNRELGFSIQYPEHWSVQESSREFEFRANDTTAFSVFCTGTTSPFYLADRVCEELDVDIIEAESSRRTTNSVDWVVRKRASEDGMALVGACQGSSAVGFIIAATANTNEWKGLEPTYNAMLDSFRFN